MSQEEEKYLAVSGTKGSRAPEKVVRRDLTDRELSFRDSVCELHFADADVERSYETLMPDESRYKIPKTPTLKRGAIPNVNITVESVSDIRATPDVLKEVSQVILHLQIPTYRRVLMKQTYLSGPAKTNVVAVQTTTDNTSENYSKCMESYGTYIRSSCTARYVRSSQTAEGNAGLVPNVRDEAYSDARFTSNKRMSLTYCTCWQTRLWIIEGASKNRSAVTIVIKATAATEVEGVRTLTIEVEGEAEGEATVLANRIHIFHFYISLSLFLLTFL